MIKFCSKTHCRTVCVTCVWAGVDSVREQEKLEARKMLENAAESHTSGARFVRQVLEHERPFFLNLSLATLPQLNHRQIAFDFELYLLVLNF